MCSNHTFMVSDIVEEDENTEPTDTSLPSRTSLHQLRQVVLALIYFMIEL